MESLKLFINILFEKFFFHCVIVDEMKLKSEIYDSSIETGILLCNF